MVRITFANLAPKTDILAGAALGEKHWEQIASVISAQATDTVTLFDFRGINAVTPSYLKKTLADLYRSNVIEQSSTRLFPLYTNLSRSTEEDLHHFLVAYELPGLVVQAKGKTLTFLNQIGCIEAAANETLSRLSSLGRGSAADVMGTANGSAIALTAWNNRLAELFRLRLATRVKIGRFWIYRPIVEVNNNG